MVFILYVPLLEEKRGGTVGEWMERSLLVLTVPDSNKKICQFTQPENGYPALCRAGESEGGEEEKWQPIVAAGITHSRCRHKLAL